MSFELVVDVLRQSLWTTFWLGAPLLLVGFIAGIGVSLLQIVTSIQDSAFGTVPRLAAFLAGLVLLMPWMLKKLAAYTVAVFGDFGRYAG
ncbi:MAG TPA: flagellar biosynthetic protein FliQ [Bryobacteraceae bacterium]|jgi:flagellar biosynthetic protein FliQ|nr:flagellar biosynthetic protein FliQ [Bryobacteraceae bacterium]